MRTLETKYVYNTKLAKEGNEFAKGYIFGVNLYREYPKADVKNRERIKEEISVSFLAVAVFKDAELSAEYDKGKICGYRDAANARKAKQAASPDQLPSAP